MSAAAFKKVLEHVDEDDLTRNERLLNLRELDCEIKERELKLAEHLKDLELREAAVTQRKRDIAAELQYELGLELEKVRAHEEEVRRRRDALDAEVKQREDALQARREILIAEREWTLKAKEDAPKGVLGEVFEPTSRRWARRMTKTCRPTARTWTTPPRPACPCSLRTRCSSGRSRGGGVAQRAHRRHAEAHPRPTRLRPRALPAAAQLPSR